MLTVLQLFGTESDTLYTGIHAWKNFMPKLCEWIGGTKTEIYCQATYFLTFVPEVSRIIRVDPTKVGNQAKPL